MPPLSINEGPLANKPEELPKPPRIPGSVYALLVRGAWKFVLICRVGEGGVVGPVEVEISRSELDIFGVKLLVGVSYLTDFLTSLEGEVRPFGVLIFLIELFFWRGVRVGGSLDEELVPVLLLEETDCLLS